MSRRIKLVNSRVVVNAMEPRSAMGVYDAASGRYTLHVPSQGVFGMKGSIADILKVEPKQVRIRTGNVGGSFGMKAAPFPEYVCVLHAARALGRPVKWTDDRSGSFVSDSHGRDHEVTAELALDADGSFLAVRLTSLGNVGGFLSQVAPMPSTLNAVRNVQSVYRTPLIEVSTKCVFTNTTHVSAYRGAGRPEGNYYMERLIDVAADEMEMDRLELRRRNYIKARELPRKTASGSTYDSGDFPAVLKHALEVADVKSFRRRKRESRRRGKLRGLGIGSFLECTAPPSKEMGGIRFEVDGTVTIITGTLDYGQGHAAPFAQVLTEKLGVPFERIRLMQGDSDELLAGGGTGGSKSIMHSGTAIVEAACKVIEQGKQIASHVLEAAASDIEFSEGRFVIAGTDRSVGLMELAEQLRCGVPLPENVPSTLDVRHVSDGPGAATFPNGCHVCEVELDPETGVIEVVKYASVNDFGTVINPLIVEGQLHGGVIQGVGQALMEMTVYDPDGQFLTGSFMDYALPRAADFPPVTVVNHPVPATTNVLGVKGCGEAGCAGCCAVRMRLPMRSPSSASATSICRQRRTGSGARSRTPGRQRSMRGPTRRSPNVRKPKRVSLEWAALAQSLRWAVSGEGWALVAPAAQFDRMPTLNSLKPLCRGLIGCSPLSISRLPCDRVAHLALARTGARGRRDHPPFHCRSVKDGRGAI